MLATKSLPHLGNHFSRFSSKSRMVLATVLVSALASATFAFAAIGDAADPVLQYSVSANRSNSLDLQNKTLSGNVYIFANVTDAKSVWFYMDPKVADLTKIRPSSRETYTPFDFAHTIANGNAIAFDTKRLQDGTHKLSIVVTKNNGAKSTHHADFIVKNNATTTTAAPTTTPATTTPSTGGELNLPRVEWEGGPAYWSKFSKAKAMGWDDPNFFPFAVFFGKPDHAAKLKDAGINVYMGAERWAPNAAGELQTLKNAGMFVLAQGDWTKAEADSNPYFVGWHVSDECDMGYSGCTPDWNNDNGEYGRLEIQKKYVAEARAHNDGRIVQANFGSGVLRTWWSPNTMDDHVALMDASSMDKYAYTSPGVNQEFGRTGDWLDQGGTIANSATSAAYGWQMDQMRKFHAPGQLKPIWPFIETAEPYLTEPDARTITPSQIEGAVWSSIVHEARGISFFQHNSNNACPGYGYSINDCPQVHTKVKEITAKVRSLAPVINTQSYQYDFKNGADTMLKVYQGHAYIFASIGIGEKPVGQTFVLPPGINGKTIEVVGEDRTIAMNGDRFSDPFPFEFTHHVYKISLK